MSVGVSVIEPGPVLETLLHSAARTAVSGWPDEQALAELRRSGLLATAVPVEYGGAGGDAATVNSVVERVARVNPSVAIILFQHFAVTMRVVEWGSAEQKAALLPAFASGECLAASAWSERGAGAAKKNISTTGVRTPDGRWRLNGAKSFTTGAGVADIYLVLATTAAAHDDRSGEDAQGVRNGQDARNGQDVHAGQDGLYGSAGQSFFLVRGDNPGLEVDRSLDLAGMRGSATGFVNLRDCEVPDEDRLGPLGQAPAIIAAVRETGATLGAVSVGIAQAALDIAIDHARRPGPLGTQAARQRLAELSAQVEAARAIVDSAGRRLSATPGTVTLQSKLFASATAEQVCLEVARMLGSTAYVVGHQLNRLIADARAVALMGPTNDLCRDLMAASWTN
ncbi:acyl-CoA dehydrogenase family protein [Streptosporangium sp. NPDC048047]|uniref:acyl-CoA dehydrogenase family protein n=1 Tax=Streptosporangium sp. NPDC048047 TaxID=3155748 RepID=UPI003427FA08